MTTEVGECSVTAVSNFLFDLKSRGITVVARDKVPSVWADVLSRVSYQPVDCAPAMIDYQLAYWIGNGSAGVDLSLVLLHDGRHCGLWPLSLLSRPGGDYRLCTNGGPILPPIFVQDLSQRTCKVLLRHCLGSVQRLAADLKQDYIDSNEGFIGALGLSGWHDSFMSLGATAELRHDLFLDLSLTIVEIKALFRKSFKSLVTSGSKLWDVEVLTGENIEKWDEFRCLHLAVAGRVTRSDESWRLQHEAVSSGCAFLVTLRGQGGAMVGGGLFYSTRDEGLYAVGAYDRSLFDRPLGHVVQYHAIQEFKARGVRWYRLGERAYPSHIPRPTSKEITISDFKEGFSSHLMPRYCLRLDTSVIV